MYEAPAKSRSQLAIRKSPSMPMLDIAIIGGDAAYMDSSSALKCPFSSGRKTPTPIHRKLKSAVSLCVGILVCTIVLFVLVALDPSKVAEEPWRVNSRSPRMRVALPSYRHWSNHGALLDANSTDGDEITKRLGRDGREPVHGLEAAGTAALEGMGMLFRRGTRGMTQLVVAHLAESTTVDDLRLFLRGLHRSGMPAHADVVLLFPFRPVATEFRVVIQEEETYFQKLLSKREEHGRATSRKLVTFSPDVHEPKLSVFNSGAYTRTPPAAELTTTGPHQDVSIWGRRHNDTSSKTVAPIVDAPENFQPAVQEDEAVPHYGAVVGFDVQELDPDDALSGFLQSPPIHLRRWLCYQMLLGMVRHRYRHVLVTETTGVVILTDALASLKKKDASELHLFATAQKWSDMDPYGTNAVPRMEFAYGKGVWKSLDEEEKRKKVISTGVILGGVRPVRSVAAAMATEVVRVALLRKSREPFRDASLLSYLVQKSSALGRKVASHLQVHESGSLTVNLLPGTSRSHSLDDIFFRLNGNRHGDRNESQFAVIQGLKNEGISEERRKRILESLRMDICQSQNDREIYTDCYTN